MEIYKVKISQNELILAIINNFIFSPFVNFQFFNFKRDIIVTCYFKDYYMGAVILKCGYCIKFLMVKSVNNMSLVESLKLLEQ